MKHIFTLLLVVGLSACAQTQSPELANERETQFKVAELSEQSGQFQSALNLYQRLYDIEPSDDVSVALGRLYYRQGEWVKAQNYLTQVSPEGGSHQEAQLWLARTHLSSPTQNRRSNTFHCQPQTLLGRIYMVLRSTICSNTMKHKRSIWNS